MQEFQCLPKRQFYRTTSCSLDAQGRIVIPKQWREGDDIEHTEYILVPGFLNSIDFYPKDQYDARLAQALRAPNQPEAQTHLAILYSICQPTFLDKQGRFTPDEELLKYAGITKDIACVGVMSYGSLYDKARWEKIKKQGAQPAPVLTPEQEAALTDDQKYYLNIKKALDFIGKF